MKQDGILQVAAETDRDGHSAQRRATIGVRCIGDTRAVACDLAEIDAVHRVILTAGTFDALVEVTHRDDQQLLDVVNRVIRAIPQITSTETLVELGRIE
jgi:Lrp/AsnC family transcriptional regulator, regulator for asnA, asnC and gidA